MIKKILMISLVLAVIVCAVGSYVNYNAYMKSHNLKWSVKTYGGEITIEHGFGWESVHIYGMSPEESDSHKLTFSPFSLLLSLAAVFAVCFLVCLAVSGLLKLRKH